MPPLTRLATARSRMFRRSQGLQTPEPQAQTIPEQPPSPPRQRFRLKRRNAPQMNTAPTQQFLESVAAADVPIPSIEEPANDDSNMICDNTVPIIRGCDIMDVSEMSGHSFRAFSPPRTPAPITVSDTMSPEGFPDWSFESPFGGIDSSPECDDSRPSTARSTLTSASIFSRFSVQSDDLSEYDSPALEQKSMFGDYLSPEDAQATIKPSAVPAKLRKARWSKSMSDHLWATYMMYLQDPKVTPIRIGKSGIPPHGVLLRVARQARRMWKGPAGQPSTKRSGSTTPTANELPRTQPRWPHTDAATRAHLRDLCRSNAGSTTRTFRYMANSPTPGSRFATRRSRRSTPGRSPSVFSSSDMAMSLALSTSESMQAQGPLAQLASSESPGPMNQELPPLPAQQATLPSAFTSMFPASPPRLGSPFVVKSYGPSSSSSLAAAFDVESTPQRQSQTVGARRNPKTPGKVEQRSRSNTQSRRPRIAKVEQRRPKRPSLASDLWNEPTSVNQESSVFPNVEPLSSSDDVFMSQVNAAAPSEGLQASFAPISMPAMADAPARLGSPFSMPSSFSLPGRFFRSRGLDFSSIGQSNASGGENDHNDPSSRSSLPFRLSALDQRFRELRRRSDGSDRY